MRTASLEITAVPCPKNIEIPEIIQVKATQTPTTKVVMFDTVLSPGLPQSDTFWTCLLTHPHIHSIRELDQCADELENDRDAESERTKWKVFDGVKCPRVK